MPHGHSPSGAPVQAAGSGSSVQGLLMDLLREGRSFSGNERNCLFLNTRDGRFSDVSLLSGLAFADDARAIARVDWDHDGDLDLWVGNRSAPQVRFLRNDLANGQPFVAVRLQGVSCNRDAIGARVEVVRPPAAGRQVKHVVAGDGFLSQSSKWLHFGLGGDDERVSVDVHWPGGSSERFEGLRSDRHYRLVQGSARAEVWPLPARELRLQPATPPPPRPATPGLVSVSPLTLPTLSYRTFAGQSVDLAGIAAGRPLLINLWASWCPACLTELADITAEADALRAAGVELIALSVDGLDPAKPASNPRAARRVLERLQFPFISGLADTALLSRIQMLNNLLFDLHRPLPVPTSLLVDGSGRLVGIAKGAISAAEVLAAVDGLHREESMDRLEQATLPFAGRWISRPSAGRFEVDLVGQLITEGLAADAARYVLTKAPAILDNPRNAGLLTRLGNELVALGNDQDAAVMLARAAELQPGRQATRVDLGWTLLRLARPAEAQGHFEAALRIRSDMASAHLGLGSAHERQARPSAAAEHYRAALDLDAGLEQGYKGLVSVYQRQGRPQLAISTLRRAIDEGLTFEGLHYRLGALLQQQGQPGPAIEHYRAELARDGGFLTARIGLARLLSTTTDAGLRDGAAALRYARESVDQGDGNNPFAVAALAAALAELQRFDEALASNRLATKLAHEQTRTQLLELLDHQRQAFERGKPYRSSR